MSPAADAKTACLHLLGQRFLATTSSSHPSLHPCSSLPVVRPPVSARTSGKQPGGQTSPHDTNYDTIHRLLFLTLRVVQGTFDQGVPSVPTCSPARSTPRDSAARIHVCSRQFDFDPRARYRSDTGKLEEPILFLERQMLSPRIDRSFHPSVSGKPTDADSIHYLRSHK